MRSFFNAKIHSYNPYEVLREMPELKDKIAEILSTYTHDEYYNTTLQ